MLRHAESRMSIIQIVSTYGHRPVILTHCASDCVNAEPRVHGGSAIEAQVDYRCLRSPRRDSHFACQLHGQVRL